MQARAQFPGTINFTTARGRTSIPATTCGTGLAPRHMQVAVRAAHFSTAMAIIILPRAGIREIRMLHMVLTEPLPEGGRCCLAQVGQLTVPAIRRLCRRATQPHVAFSVLSR